jgi:MFS superfamily sulfate permease-like transporter
MGAQHLLKETIVEQQIVNHTDLVRLPQEAMSIIVINVIITVVTDFPPGVLSMCYLACLMVLLSVCLSIPQNYLSINQNFIYDSQKDKLSSSWSALILYLVIYINFQIRDTFFGVL